MQHLFVYIDGEQQFDKRKIQNDLESLAGVKNLNGKDFSSSTIACDYQYNGYETIARLEGEPTMIVMDNTSDAALHLALELQKRDERLFRITSDSGQFNFSLAPTTSLESVRQKVEEGCFDAEAVEYEKA